MTVPQRIRLDPVGETKSSTFKANSDLNFTIENTTFLPSKSALVLDLHLPVDQPAYQAALASATNLYDAGETLSSANIDVNSQQSGYYLRSALNFVDYTKIVANNTNVVHTEHTNITTNLIANNYEQNHLDTTTNWYLNDQEVATQYEFQDVAVRPVDALDTATEKIIQWSVPLNVVDMFLDQDIIYGMTSLQINMKLLSNPNFLYGFLLATGELHSPLSVQGGTPYAGWYFDNAHLLLKTEDIQAASFSLTGDFINVTQANRIATLTNSEKDFHVNYSLSDTNARIIGEYFTPVAQPQMMITPFKTHQIQLTQTVAIPATEPGNRQECLFSTLDALDKLVDERSGSSTTLKRSYINGIHGNTKFIKRSLQLGDGTVALTNVYELSGTKESFDPGTTGVILYDLEATVGDKGADLNQLPKNITFKLVTSAMPEVGDDMDFNRFAVTISPVTLTMRNDVVDISHSKGYGK